MGSPAQPLLDLRSRIGQASREFLNSHPIDALESALGIPLGEPARAAPAPGVGTLPPQWEAANRIGVQQGLDAERKAEARNVPRRKPILSGR